MIRSVSFPDQHAESRSCRFLRPEPRIWHGLAEPRIKMRDLDFFSVGEVSKNFGVEFQKCYILFIYIKKFIKWTEGPSMI